MSAVYSKQLLSASSNGRQIAVTGTVAPGTTLHQPSSGSNVFDEVWVYAINTGSITANLSTYWGGTNTTDLLVTPVTGTNRVLVADGRILQNTTFPVSAFVNAGTILVDGFVNRIDPGLDPIVVDWVARVIRNGGAAPSSVTQNALNVFVGGLNRFSLTNKMLGMCCFVPDSLTAALTPLIRGGFDPWLNNNFVSGDLNVNGLTGNASNKTLNTGIYPGQPTNVQGLMGFSYYVQNTTATGFCFGCYDGTHNFIGAAKYTDNNAYGYNSGSSGSNVIITPSPGAGFYTDLRVSSTDHRLYFAKSTTAFGQIGSTDTLAESGSYLVQPIFVFCVNLTSGTVQLPCSDTMSFVAVHANMTSTDASNLFTLVQALRSALGGGFV